MSLNRFSVTRSFIAWSPGDREHPERQVSISPGAKHLFTDEAPSGVFVKFLKSGCWYEAEREEFVRSTVSLGEHSEEKAFSAQHGA